MLFLTKEILFKFLNFVLETALLSIAILFEIFPANDYQNDEG
jgi:hypothetical protein